MKKVLSLIGLIVVVIVGVTFAISTTNADKNKEETDTKDTTVYTLQQALSTDVYTANVDVEEKSLTLSTKRMDKNFDIQDSKELVLSEETEKELINQMVQWELVKYNDFDLTKSLRNDSHYDAYLTVSTGYKLYLDSVDKTIAISDKKQAYKIQNSGDFFTILKNIKEASAN
ncbi:hypothetical protein [Solibacillus sp. FSL K6-1554]|uniref:hypothetical protein n=1 Tax=Solibacillus sp. FSL K6-1554 TaxID=2921472 RepID=UPI0030FC2061